MNPTSQSSLSTLGPLASSLPSVSLVARQIADAVLARFEQSPYLAIRRLDCEYHEGVLTIRGHLPTFYLKQLAQTLAQQVPDIEMINNCAQVAYAQSKKPPSTRG